MRFENLGVCLAKNPACPAEDERKNAETNPESPKPNRLPPQLRFSLSNAVLQIAILPFELSYPLLSPAELFVDRFALCISTEGQFNFLAYLEIALRNSGILFFDFLFRNF